MRPTRRVLLAALALLLVGPEAQVSQVHYESVPLEELVGQCGVLAVVTLAEPPMRQVTFTWTERDEAGIERQGQHGVVFQRFLVGEVLKAPAGALSPGQLVEVHHPDVVDGLQLSLEYELSGLSISPIYFAYDEGVNLSTPGQQGIACLATPTALTSTPERFAASHAQLAEHLAGTWSLAVGGSIIDLAKRAEVEALLAR